MERLLNIKEAAEFLNVSEMTVRRWTNKGQLNCYRVGGRRARRFRIQDLTDFLEADQATAATAMVPLGVEDAAVPGHSHITHLSTEENEALEVAAAYILEGLRGNETVFVVAPGEKTGPIMNALRRKEASIAENSTAGRLHFSQGRDSPALQRKYLSDLAVRSQGRFRVFGDMTWTREKNWRTEDLYRLEKSMDRTDDIEGGIFLCQYALDRFTGTEIMMALDTHTHNIYRGRLIDNPYEAAAATVLRTSMRSYETWRS